MLHGEQHRDCDAIKNPYSSKMSDLDSLKVATLKARLDQQLGPEYITTRSNGGAGRVSYIEGHKAIMLANEVFGFDGWNTSIVRFDVDFLDQRGEVWDLGLAVIVRITLKCGTYREDTGYGSIKNCRDKSSAFEKARKEATTDAIKRALRQFGNVMGNCIYDKTYLENIKKMRKEPEPRFNPDLLYRPPTLQRTEAPGRAAAPPSERVQAPPVNPQPPAMTSTFDDIDFAAEFAEDRITFDELATMTIESPNSSSNEREAQNHPNYCPPGDFAKPKQVVTDGSKQVSQQEANRLKALKIREEKELFKQRQQEVVHAGIQAPEPGTTFQPSFLNARTLVTPGTEPARFDPKLQSPSIPRTAGIDLSKSTPIKRPGIESPVSATNAGSPLAQVPSPGPPNGMVTRQHFRAPTRMNPVAKGNPLLTAKRTNEALSEHPNGSVAINGANDADKRPRV